MQHAEFVKSFLWSNIEGRYLERIEGRVLIWSRYATSFDLRGKLITNDVRLLFGGFGVFSMSVFSRIIMSYLKPMSETIYEIFGDVFVIAYALQVIV